MCVKQLWDKELTDAKTTPTRALRIKKILDERFAPHTLDIVDESSRHSGHAGARPEGETHFRVHMVTAAFNGLSRVARHRAVMSALSDEFASGLHALALELKSEQDA